MNLLGWIIIGGIAGWLASKIMKTDHSMGVFANIIVGVVGAFIGGFVLNMLGGPGVENFSIYSLLVATLGSVILLAIMKALGR